MNRNKLIYSRKITPNFLSGDERRPQKLRLFQKTKKKESIEAMLLLSTRKSYVKINWNLVLCMYLLMYCFFTIASIQLINLIIWFKNVNFRFFFSSENTHRNQTQDFAVRLNDKKRLITCLISNSSNKSVLKKTTKMVYRLLYNTYHL